MHCILLHSDVEYNEAETVWFHLAHEVIIKLRILFFIKKTYLTLTLHASDELSSSD